MVWPQYIFLEHFSCLLGSRFSFLNLLDYDVKINSKWQPWGGAFLQSPKKVNLVAELVRGMRVDDALMQMAVSTKRAAKVVAKVIETPLIFEVHFV